MTQEVRYINPLTDFGFKKIFGDEEIMRAFLTDLLCPASPIKEIIFLDKELSAQTQYERGVVYDLRCKTEEGGEFIVEMQNKSQAYFSDRILYYLSRSFSSQEERGSTGWNYMMKPVYGIFFLNFHLSGFQPQPVRTVQLKVNETGELFSDKLRVYTLELPEYEHKQESDCKTMIDYWLYNLKNMETMTQQIPFQTQQPIFGKMSNIARLVNMSPADLAKYNISIDEYRTNRACMDFERAEGWAEGIKEGRAEGEAVGLKKGRAEGEAVGLKKGRAEGEAVGLKKGEAVGLKKGRAEGRAEGQMLMQLQIAKSMKSMGMPSGQISTVTGLSKDEIDKL